MFQSRKQDYFNWKFVPFGRRASLSTLFQSRKQDYFNWKNKPIKLLKLKRYCFSPASRIILIESRPGVEGIGMLGIMFQSRKQDYFNWKKGLF